MLTIQQIPALNDNYIYLIHDSKSMETAVIDPAIALPVLTQLESHHWSLNYIFNTHHHNDHIGGNLDLKQQTRCKIAGAITDQYRIPNIDIPLQDGDRLQLGNYSVEIIECHGHTSGHIAFYIPEAAALFCGDTLFSLGCGRLFEGTAAQMHQSLTQFSKLPRTTKIYCAHEYTTNNAQFALSVEPQNPKLLQRIEQVTQLRANHQATVPSTLEQERASNPFLRTHSPEIRQSLNLKHASELEVFTELRKRKDNF